MDARITKIEKDLSIMNHNQQGMSESLKSIARSSSKIVEVHMDTKLLEERLIHLNENLKESFNRVHTRIDDQEKQLKEEIETRQKKETWLARIIIGGILTGFVAFVIKGGLNV